MHECTYTVKLVKGEVGHFKYVLLSRLKIKIQFKAVKVALSATDAQSLYCVNVGQTAHERD